MDRSGRIRGADARGRDYESLRREQWRLVDGVIEEVRQTGHRAVRTIEKTEYYAYPHPGGGVAWGVNSGLRGFSAKRGVKR